MAKGNKICPACGTNNGPRSWNCKSCGKGFIVKGIQMPDVTPGGVPIMTAIVPVPIKRSRINASGVIKRCQDPHELKILRKYGSPRARSWDSLDGHYRIRYMPSFMGVSAKLEDGKSFRLLQRIGPGEYEPVHVESEDDKKHRFRKLKSAVKSLIKMKKERDKINGILAS